MNSFSNLMTSENILRHFSEAVFHNQEWSQYHNPYDQELREYQALENGDWDQLKKSLDEQHEGKLGRLAKNDIRHLKNMGIVVVTLSCRAAIRGGILPEVAFTLSDAYIQKLEELNDPKEIEETTYYCKYHYCQLVSNTKAKLKPKKNIPHSKINQCKTYIFSHLHGRISVQEIASALNTSPTYLADLFRNYEGQTISSFILQEKIKLVQNMLIYSPYSYSEIAAYLGFSSQSHLGAQFKKVTGYTLRQYRETFQNLPKIKNAKQKACK